ncbi:EF-hand domain-containing protein [Marivita sp. S2033]|uniref:EF-hand domain-containing protein n=1 Tax=Marivita sp. S2033 TaxID=3373187 RepID=UPI003981A30A
MKTSTQISAVLVAALMATGAATTVSAQSASTRDDRRAEMFQQMDADGDGSISAEEFAANGDRFSRADTDGDGMLTVEEIVAGSQDRAKRMAEQMIERMDTDGDGALSQDEIEARGNPDRMFDRMDSNNDDMISKDEFADARMGDRDGRGHGKGHGKGRYSR